MSIYLTDGGIETTLVFHEGLDLPCFAAFDLLKDAAGTQTLNRYYRRYAELAVKFGCGFVLEAPTWRASSRWAGLMGYTEAELREANFAAMALMSQIKADLATETSPMILSGCLGPRDDGYCVNERMSQSEAERYHFQQAAWLKEAGAERLNAMTLNYVEEAAGIADAAAALDMPLSIAFTVETDGRLPSGESLEDAIAAVDTCSRRAPVDYMINCAHVTHFSEVLRPGVDWTRRIRGIRANASCKSHEELDEATELDDGNPVVFGREYRELLRQHPQISLLGGCCGTDHRHLEQVAHACLH